MKNIVAYPQEDFLFTILLGSFRRLKSKLGKQSEKVKKMRASISIEFCHSNIIHVN
jgi:hypothetical protein